MSVTFKTSENWQSREIQNPNGKSKERKVLTETDYLFYAPEDLFYGLNIN